MSLLAVDLVDFIAWFNDQNGGCIALFWDLITPTKMAGNKVLLVVGIVEGKGIIY